MVAILEEGTDRFLSALTLPACGGQLHFWSLLKNRGHLLKADGSEGGEISSRRLHGEEETVLIAFHWKIWVYLIIGLYRIFLKKITTDSDKWCWLVK